MKKAKDQKIVLTMGLPGSGKNYWAERLMKTEKGADFVNINRDDLRIMLSGSANYSKFRKWRENIVTRIQEDAVVAAINEGKSVIVSDTNLNIKPRARFEELASTLGVGFEINDEFMKTPIGVCIDRDKVRGHQGGRRVGQSVITGMYKKYIHMWEDRGLLYEANEKLPHAFVFDIDGTLAKMNGRSPYDYAKVGTDLPNTAVVNVAASLAEDGYAIILLSGRDGSCESATRLWLEEHDISYDELYIRPAGDNRPDYEIKRELFETFVEPNYHVLGVFDDRDQVVHLWRSLGLTCMQCDYGSF